MSEESEQIEKNLIVVSDTHCGSRLGLCPPEPIPLDDGGEYHASELQRRVWQWWCDFWDEWVPQVTKGQPYGVVVNGDLVDGKPFAAMTPISDNPSDQATIAERVFEPIFENPLVSHHYIIRGTEAHVGKSAHQEEMAAKNLGAIPNELGQYARYELWIRVGKGLCHIMHHIGTTASSNYESTAPHAEMIAEFVEASRWREEPPNFVIRSHRHRLIMTVIPAEIGDAISIVTPGWQLKTPHAWRIAGARLAPPQFGGILIRQGDEDIFTRHKVWALSRSKVEVM